jgi:carbamoyl-phosphate synthase (ammonia)
MATRAMVGEPQLDMDVNVALKGADDRPVHPQGYVGVKVPMFSFKRLLGADPTLGVEMASTGEVACYGATKEEAFLKALLSTDAKFAMENKSVLLSIQDQLQPDFLPSAKKLEAQLGFTLYATEKTAQYLEEHGIQCTRVAFPGDGNVGQEDIEQMIRDNKIDLVLMFANNFSEKVEHNYDIRRLAVDFGVPLLTNLQVADLFADAMLHAKNEAGGDLLQYLETKTLKEHYGDRV